MFGDVLSNLDLSSFISKGAQVWSDIGYTNCLRHLFRSRVITNLNLFFRKDLFAFIHAH